MKETLLLNSAFQPIGSIGRRKCLDLLYFRQKAEIICHYENNEPAVIRLTVRTPNPYSWMSKIESSRYSKNKVFIRDNFTCIYCGYFSRSKKGLTIDHVYPRSKGGVSSYKNCVTCCKSCNVAKGDMVLEKHPIKKYHTITMASFYSAVPVEWEPYIYREKNELHS